MGPAVAIHEVDELHQLDADAPAHAEGRQLAARNELLDLAVRNGQEPGGEAGRDREPIEPTQWKAR